MTRPSAAAFIVCLLLAPVPAGAESLRSRAGRADEITAIVGDLYDRRDLRALWVRGPRDVDPQAWSALAVLYQAWRDGLDPADYTVDEVGSALRYIADNPECSRAEAGRLDMVVTRAVVTYAHDLIHGRVEAADLKIVARLPPPPIDIARAVADGVEAGRIEEVLRGLVPAHEGYRKLRDVLQKYEAIAVVGGWPAVPGGDAVQPGSVQPRARLDALEQRLAAEQYVAGAEATPHLGASFRRHQRSASDRVYDEALQAGVRLFQAMHGLDVDGVVGPQTLAELNRPAADVVHTIKLNMEKWRWLPAELGSHHVWVNIPFFALDCRESGRSTLSMPIIAGTVVSGTPLFSDSIEAVILNPSWNVPDRIARREILPHVIANRAALAAGGFDIVTGWGPRARIVAARDIDWRGMTPAKFPYHLRQRPGRLNPLGKVKFSLPNAFDVYLHDTPSYALFAASDRAFSHGCVRVARPLDLAAWLLAGQHWDREDIRKEVGTGAQRSVRLDRPVPVHIVYFTAVVTTEGRLELRRDVYGIDAKLSAALATGGGTQ